MDNRPIGVFDSGLGGLTAVRQINRLLPCEDVVYFGDTGRVPYGTRGRDTIIRYARQDIQFLLQHDVKIIVVACGTASTALTETDTEDCPVPLLGVVTPAAQAACAASNNGTIGVIGTTYAVRSGAYGKALRAIQPEVRIIGKACPLFIPLVENGFVAPDNEVTRLVAKQYLSGLAGENIDTLIMGCTHFPIIRDIISEVLNYSVTLIDPGEETVKSAASYLTERGLLCGRQTTGERRYYVTDNTESFCDVAEIFLGEKIDGSVEQVSLAD